MMEKQGKRKNQKNRPQPMEEHFHTPEPPIEKLPSKNQFSTQEKEQIRTFVSKLELGDLCFSEIIEYGFALFGETKAGKTTLAHYLVHNPLISKATPDNPAYVLDTTLKTNKLGQAVIGMKHESQTVIPNSCQIEEIKIDNKKAVLLDCPGYSDSKGSFLVITNAYFHYRVFSKVKNLKFIITFDANGFTEAFDKPVRTLYFFLKSFKNISQIKDKIFAATVFFFTKISPRAAQSIHKILETLKICAAEKLNTYNRQYPGLVKELIDKIANQNKVFTFQQAEVNIKASESKHLKKIHQVTHFWRRNINEDLNEVDMSHIQFSVGRDVSRSPQEEFQKKFELLCLESAERFQNAMGFDVNKSNIYCFPNIINQFLTDSICSKAGQKIFTDFIKQYVQKFYIYGKLSEETQRNNKMYYKQKRDSIKHQILNHPLEVVDKCPIQWIQKLEISKGLLQFLQNLFEYHIKHGYPRTIQFFAKISQNLLRIISQFKKINFFKAGSIEQINHVSIIENFCYIIYRLLQEAKIFKIIFDYRTEKQPGTNEYQLYYTDKTSVIFDMISEIIQNNCQWVETQNFENIKISFIVDHLEIIPNETLNYYEQIEKYCKPVKGEARSKEFNEKLAKITKFKLNSNRLNLDKNSKISSLIQNVKRASANFQHSNQIKNIEIYIQSMNELGDQLSKQYLTNNQLEHHRHSSSEIQQAKNYIKCALKIYKHVNNVYKVIESYKFLKTKYNEKSDLLQLKGILIEFAQYACAHGRRELAMENLQYAYHLIDLIHKNLFDKQDYQTKRIERQQLAQKIGFLGVGKRYDPSEKYYDKMLTKKFCTLIEQEELKEIMHSLSIGF